MKRLFLGTCLVGICGLLVPATARASLLQVPTYTYPTIQSAVDTAAPGDTVQVEPGIYTSCITTGPTGSLNCIVIEGSPGSPFDLCLTVGPGEGIAVVDAQFAGRCICLKHAGGTRIQGFEFRNGLPNGNGTHGGDGGAMCVVNSRTVTLVDCQFYESRTPNGDGGGLYLTYSTALIRASAFASNDADFQGGGLAAINDCRLELIQCGFEGNSAGSEGGGLSVEVSSTIELAGGTIFDNFSGIAGGGIYVSNVSEMWGCNTYFGPNSAPVAPDGWVDMATSLGDLSHCTWDPARWIGNVTQWNLECPDLSQCSIDFAPTEQVSVYNRPDCQGNAFDEARTRGGDPAIADVTVTLCNILGQGIPSIPANRVWLEQDAYTGAFKPCSQCCLRHHRFPIADAATNGNGETVFHDPLCAGGQTNPVAGDRIVVMTAWGRIPGQVDLQFNSADLNGDRWVNLTDVSIFAGDIGNPPHYHYRSDFLCDGDLNLSDLTVFAQALGAMCPWSCE